MWPGKNQPLEMQLWPRALYFIWGSGCQGHKYWIWISFLAVHNSSIGLIVPCLVGPSVTTNNQSLHNTTEWPLRLVTFETFDQTCWWQFLMTFLMTIFDDIFWWQFLMSNFYRTQVNLGSDLWVRMSQTNKQTFVRLNWCDSGWWGYQLNNNW